MVSYLCIMKEKAFPLYNKAHFGLLSTRASDHCYSLTCGDHMGGSAA